MEIFWRLEKIKKQIKRRISLNWYNRLSGEERKSRDDMASYYWSVFKECVQVCDNSISLFKE
jgi:hypothetical protein